MKNSFGSRENFLHPISKCLNKNFSAYLRWVPARSKSYTSKFCSFGIDEMANSLNSIGDFPLLTFSKASYLLREKKY